MDGGPDVPAGGRRFASKRQDKGGRSNDRVRRQKEKRRQLRLSPSASFFLRSFFDRRLLALLRSRSRERLDRFPATVARAGIQLATTASANQQSSRADCETSNGSRSRVTRRAVRSSAASGRAPRPTPTAIAGRAPITSPSRTTILKTSRRIGAERHAHANLLRPLRDGIGDHAVDADRSPGSTPAPRTRHQQHADARLFDRAADTTSVSGRTLAADSRRIDLADHAADRARQRGRIAGASEPSRRARGTASARTTCRPSAACRHPDRDSCTSPTTPTIVRQSFGYSGLRMRRRRPTGSTPGKMASASARLITTTGCRAGAVGACEGPPAQHRRAHGAEEVWRRRNEERAVFRPASAAGRRSRSRVPRCGVDRRQPGCRARRLDAGQLREPVASTPSTRRARAPASGSFTISTLNDSTWSVARIPGRARSARRSCGPAVPPRPRR